VRQLEQLVARHVVIPARNSFFAHPPGTRQDSDVDVSSSAVDAVLKELQPLQVSTGNATIIGTLRTQISISKLLPRFLDITLRAIPRKSLKQQSVESPWLETLFVALTEIAGFPIRNITPRTVHQPVGILEDLLTVAIDGELRLSLKLLHQYASNFSRVFDEHNTSYAKTYDSHVSPCEWSLLAKMTCLGIDIFIPNSGIPDARSLLDATFNKATALRLAPSSLADGYYAFIKTKVIIPIMEGFARARDLSGFIDCWYERLTCFSGTVTEKDLRKSSLEFPIWESEDLITAFSKLVPFALTSDQIKAQYVTATDELRSISAASDTFLSAMNRTRIIDGLLQANLSEDSNNSLADATLNLALTVVTVLNAEAAQKPTYRWRLWRILWQIAAYPIPDPVTSHTRGNSMKNLGQEVPQIMRQILDSPQTCKWQHFAEAFEAFRYLAASVYHPGTRDDTETVSNAIDTMTATLHKADRSPEILASFQWDGRVQSLDSRLKLSLAYAGVLVNCPSLLKCVPSQTRQKLFRALYCLARDSKVGGHNYVMRCKEEPFSCIWTILVAHNTVLKSAPLWEDLLQVQIAEMEQVGFDHAILDALTCAPPEAISRPRRTKILDIALQHVGSMESTDRVRDSLLPGIISVMICILDLANPTALILTDAESLWTLVEKTNAVDWDTATCSLLQTLVTSVLDSLRLNQTSTRSMEYCATFLQRIDLLLQKAKSFLEQPAKSALLKASLPVLWSHKDAMLDKSLYQQLASARQRYVEVLISDVDRIQSGKASLSLWDWNCAVRKVLCSLIRFEDLLEQDQRLPNLLDQIIVELKRKRTLLTSAAIGDQEGGDLISAEMYANRLLNGMRPTLLSPRLEKQISVLNVPELTIEDRQKVLQAMKRTILKADEDEVLNFLSKLSAGDVGRGQTQSEMFILGIILSAIEPQVDRDSSASTLISSLFTELTVRLAHNSSVEIISLNLDCLDLILRTHSRSVSQWNIDSALGLIAKMTSRSNFNIGNSNAGAATRAAGNIFCRLCRVMGSMVALHRKKIGGRYHLVVAALQGLLRCLFIPERRRSKSISSSFLVQMSSRKEALGREYAVQLTRLLTMICDPTVSSVKKARSDQARQLTDETKKARGVAGQFLQYVIREYAECQLHGHISPEVKAALMPGLYAILDAMTRNGMQAMNAAMDSSSRAIFKSLYSDYMRFGKWDQT
jgi:nucleolar pre-ribosomal-associated protein 2